MLVDLDLFRRLRARGLALGARDGKPDGLAYVVNALGLVHGEPFTDDRETAWEWMHEGERIDHEIAAAAVDTALLVHATTLHADPPDLDTARLAATTALLASPYDEPAGSHSPPSRTRPATTPRPNGYAARGSSAAATTTAPRSTHPAARPRSHTRTDATTDADAKRTKSMSKAPRPLFIAGTITPRSSGVFRLLWWMHARFWHQARHNDGSRDKDCAGDVVVARGPWERDREGAQGGQDAGPRPAGDEVI